jgi:hypothetical protein
MPVSLGVGTLMGTLFGQLVGKLLEPFPGDPPGILLGRLGAGFEPSDVRLGLHGVTLPLMTSCATQ